MNDRPYDREADSAERAAHTVLKLVGDMPGQWGRLRVARIIGGYAIHTVIVDDPIAEKLTEYAVDGLDWSLRDSVELVDALISGGLIAQATGQRPTLVLTRAGFRALETLESEIEFHEVGL